jgi:dehydrogenase/reductase SDR family protein 4
MTASNPFDISGQVVLITGSTRGIGKSIAEMMAAAGAKVVVSSRKADACEAVAKEIKAAGGTAIAVPCNVSDKDQLENLVAETEKQLGPISTLVCNAATNPAYGPMANLEDKVFDKIMSTNVMASIRLMNRVAPGMAKMGGGAIILISSVAGLTGSKTIGVYGVTKAADIQLARNYALELGPQNIRVNCVAPGLIKTDFSTLLWEGKKGEDFIARNPMGRLGDGDDIAGVVMFLATKAAKYVTGQTIVADGGSTIQDLF